MGDAQAMKPERMEHDRAATMWEDALVLIAVIVALACVLIAI
jgi:hypothetical protein